MPSIFSTAVSTFSISTLIFLTVLFKVHSTKNKRSHVLLFEVPLVVDKDGGQVLIGVVRNADRGHALQELDIGEFVR